jgi:hypothetical protein
VRQLAGSPGDPAAGDAKASDPEAGDPEAGDPKARGPMTIEIRSSKTIARTHRGGVLAGLTTPPGGQHDWLNAARVEWAFNGTRNSLTCNP